MTAARAPRSPSRASSGSGRPGKPKGGRGFQPPVPWAEGARDQVGLTWRPRPFEVRTETRLVPEGRSIREMVRTAYPDEGCWTVLSVAIAGKGYRLELGEWEF